MSDTDQPEPLNAGDAARLVRKRNRKRGLRQYRTIFLLASYWTIATLTLALLGSVFHFFEVRDACADILGVTGPVDTRWRCDRAAWSWCARPAPHPPGHRHSLSVIRSGTADTAQVVEVIGTAS